MPMCVSECTETMYRNKTQAHRLEALAVDDGRAGLVVLVLADPHLLERRQGRQDGSSDPDRVLALRRGDDLDSDRRRRQGRHLLGDAVGDAVEHGRAARQDNVAVQVLTNVDVALHDRLVRQLVDALLLDADQRRLEQDLRAAESLVADRDDLTVGQFVRLLDLGRLLRVGHLGVEVLGDVRQLLLDVADDFALGRRRERVPALGQDLHQVVGQVATGQVETQDGVRQRVPFVDGDRVRDTVTTVEDDTRRTTGGVQRQDGLDGDVHGRRVERLEHDLRHLLTVGLRVQRRLRQQDRVLLGRDTQLVVERVVPDLLHVVPVRDDAVLDRVLERQDTTLGLGLVADVRVLLRRADHDAGVARTPDDRREDGARGVVAGEPGLDHAGSIVDDQGLDFLVTHAGGCCWGSPAATCRCRPWTSAIEMMALRVGASPSHCVTGSAGGRAPPALRGWGGARLLLPMTSRAPATNESPAPYLLARRLLL